METHKISQKPFDVAQSGRDIRCEFAHEFARNIVISKKYKYAH